MKKETYQFKYTVYDSIKDLSEEDAWLLAEAREVTENAYAPYSNFHVGAVAKLVNGEIVAGSNQENASFPVGLCAERVLLAAAASLYPKIPIETMAISYRSSVVESDHPISPCGICRQSLQEYEQRVKHPIRLILGGMEGKVYIIEKASMLLPLSFTSEDLQ
ncbi:cytidine deaminase [Flavihumibacter rivuli]|uniref:cytidine deaminase n=1 Tax=Flavihumibacter rivuli TaxID=2838156 RepID=UPI001BDE4FBD|nr:cytidine deaminase [Flavihumibacter rivuli]ULQ57519.1 cytidine deaminase [Flavihumibacter rivuli]